MELILNYDIFFFNNYYVIKLKIQIKILFFDF